MPLREACGVLGVASKSPILNLLQVGLRALQHRGQEGCGIVSFDGKKYPLRFAEANMFSRDNLALVIANYISNKDSVHISGPLICSEQARKYSEIFSIVCPGHSFKDFFISSDNIGKSFDPQKLLESGLMR